MSEQDNLRITRETLAAMNARELDRYLSYLAESHVWENDAFPPRFKDGRERDRFSGCISRPFPICALKLNESSPAAIMLLPVGA
jgi:hypothetical protein